MCNESINIQIGECGNTMVDGLDKNSLCIGDRSIMDDDLLRLKGYKKLQDTIITVGEYDGFNCWISRCNG